MEKRAQGLSLNTIIIAALALLVLVILAMVFTGRFGDFNRGAGDCVNKGGECSRVGCSGDYQREINYDCNLDGDDSYNEGQSVDGVCCVSI